jgi:hypothetical protein
MLNVPDAPSDVSTERRFSDQRGRRKNPLFRKVLSCYQDVSFVGEIYDKNFSVSLICVTYKLSSCDDLMVFLLVIILNKKDFIVRLIGKIDDKDFGVHLSTSSCNWEFREQLTLLPP